MKNSIVYQNQKPLIEDYAINPKKAWIVDYAKIEGKNFQDPFHTEVFLNKETENTLPIGIHRAVGGLHDIANPGDVLCGSLAACFESTLRMIANRLGIILTKTQVEVKAYADVRGTLQMDTSVPIAFQKISIKIIIAAKEDTNPNLLTSLIKASKFSCIVYQTLKNALPIELKVEIENLTEMLV